MIAIQLLYLAVLFLPSLIQAQSLFSESSCVLQGTHFGVSFAGAQAVDDWIGLVPVSKLNGSFRITDSDYTDWTQKCGASPCAAVNGRTVMSNRAASVGDHVVVLAHNALPPPYEVFAVSPVFRIDSSCPGSSNNPIHPTGTTSSPPVSVTVDSSMFAVEEPITVSFDHHHDTLSDDFIAIYPESTPENQLREGLLWAHLCNRQAHVCLPPLESGHVVFDRPSFSWARPTNIGWPLRPGRYRAYLIRNVASNNAWVVLGRTQVFSVVVAPVAATTTTTTVAPVVTTTTTITQVPTDAPITTSPTDSPTDSPVQSPPPTPIPSAPLSSLHPTDAPITRRPTHTPTSRPVVLSPPPTPSLSNHTIGSGSISNTTTDAPISSQPTAVPTARPAPTPTAVPIPIPTHAPISTQAPVLPTEAPTTRTVLDPLATQTAQNEIAAADIAGARRDIENLIRSDRDLAPKFLRLIFHDCIGICDGCVDMSNPENFGLEKPIDALEPIFAQRGGVLSRADIWALAATVGTDVTQDPADRISFPFEWWGRQDCTEQTECRGPNDVVVPCTHKAGPHHEHPTIHLNTADLYHFFLTEFNFNMRESIVAMGAHTIGTLSIENSGIDGPDGWDITNDVFDTVYYTELIGGNGPDDALDILVDDAPAWSRAIEPPTAIFRDRRIWDGFPQVDLRIIMLDDDNYVDSIGQSSCAFEDNTAAADNIPQCPALNAAVLIGAELRHDTAKFLSEFRAVLERMASNKYDRPECSDPVCQVVPLA